MHRVGRPPVVLVKENPLSGSEAAVADLVLAWARETATGEPRYILELDDHHRGADCGCECPSCGLLLVAVNAARTQWVRRPHFRHPPGAQKQDCALLAARLAALEQLRDAGTFELPARRVSARVAGLSGAFHEAWVEAPRQTVRISEVDFSDRAAALLVLDDGRTLRVELTGRSGSVVPAEGGAPLPTLVIDIDDPAIAAMGPEEIRKRLTLLPGSLCWRAHWQDEELHLCALDAARRAADDLLDALPEGLVLPDDLPAELRRETVLHHEVKRILEAAGRLRVPGPEVVEEATPPGQPTLRRRWSAEASLLAITSPRLEQRVGRLVPDVACVAWQDGAVLHDPLFVEVTVSNPIGPERLTRIREQGAATLEIDLRLAGGRVTRDELRRLVLEEVAAKRWLHHPDLSRHRERLQEEIAAELVRLHAAKQAEDERAKRKLVRQRPVVAQPLAEAAGRYLDALQADLDAGPYVEAIQDLARSGVIAGDSPQVVQANEHLRAVALRLDQAAQRLAELGFPHAGDARLRGRDGILARLLSIKLDRVLGKYGGAAIDVLRSIRGAAAPERHEWPIYLIAVRAFEPWLTPGQRQWLERWASEVRESVRRGEATYLRDPVYDELLALLFTEMGDALAKPRGRLPPAHVGSGSMGQSDPSDSPTSPPGAAVVSGSDPDDPASDPRREVPW